MLRRAGGTTMAPAASNCVCTAGVSIAAMLASRSRATIGSGVPAGRKNANQVEASNAVKPCSNEDGTLGSIGARSHSSIDSRNSFSLRVLIAVVFKRSMDSSNNGSSSSRSCALRSRWSTSSEWGVSGANMNRTGTVPRKDEGMSAKPRAAALVFAMVGSGQRVFLNLDFSNCEQQLKVFRRRNFAAFSCWHNHDP